jgi:pimeloyl-ACP methyl ester carboxylesterase
MKPHALLAFAVVLATAFTHATRLRAADPQPAPANAAGEARGKGAAGVWLGALEVGPVKLRLGVELAEVGGALQGTMTSLDQGGVKIKVDEAAFADGSLKLVLKSIGGTFEGKLSDDGSKLVGTWTQGPGKLPLTLERVDKLPSTERPQEPKKPYPYNAEELTFENEDAGIRLAGTLTFPKAGGPHPAVVLISGSGPQDRDEAVMGHRPFLVLADHLTRHGVAVLRYDDRGVARSQGDYGAASTDEFVADVLAAVAYLKSRPEIDPKRIGLLGHSEGGVTGPVAITRAPGDVAFLVMLAGVGVPLDELLVRQGRDLLTVGGAPPEAIEKANALQRKLFSAIKAAADGPAAEAAARAAIDAEVAALPEAERAAAGPMVDAQVKQVASPWFRGLLRYDPAATLAQVKCPVLAVCGEKDIQVAAKDNLAGIRAALETGGNEDVQTVELPGLNHLLQHCTTGAVSEYATIDETMAPEALDVITKWIRGHTGLEK